MSIITALRKSIDAAILAESNPDLDPFRVGMGDHGDGPTYNTVTVGDSDVMCGQAWSGAPADPDAPEDGPDGALVDKGSMSWFIVGLMKAVGWSQGLVTSSKSTGGAATLTFDTSEFDADLYSEAAGQITLTYDGDYEVSFHAWGDGATDDTMVRLWAELQGSELDGSRTVITVPTTAANGIDEGACSASVRFTASASDVIRVRHQKTVGSTFNIQRAAVKVRMVG